MLSLLSKVPLFWSFHRFGWPVLLPFSLVVSVSFRCNSRCQTCGVWRKPSEEMTAAEWEHVFAQLGHAPVYVTFTGGEPFLRHDLSEIVLSAYRHCRPSVITIPTNGLLTDRIVENVRRMCTEAPRTQIGINLSLDEIGERHDILRGVPGNWQRALKTWYALKELQPHHPNLLLTIHTVISKFNVQRFPELYAALEPLHPDSYITEIAEERVELDTVGWQITPAATEYAPLADFLTRQASQAARYGRARVTQAFRAEYYQLAKRILFEKRQVIPCYAGWASGHIAPNGDVWSCCVRAEPAGNLREHGYSLYAVWQSEPMRKLRRSIYQRECACPMANASYANMLLHLPTIRRVMRRLLPRFGK